MNTSREVVIQCQSMNFHSHLAVHGSSLYVYQMLQSNPECCHIPSILQDLLHPLHSDTIVNKEDMDEDAESIPDSPIHLATHSTEPCCSDDNTSNPDTDHQQPPITSNNPPPPQRSECIVKMKSSTELESPMNRVRCKVFKTGERRSAHRAVMHTKNAHFLGNPHNDLPDDSAMDIFLAAANDNLKTYQQAIVRVYA